MGAWKHRLTEVDLEARTAVCAVDGPVEIYVSGKQRVCKVSRQQPRVAKPGEHRMMSKDMETMTGVCSTCGPVRMNRRKGNPGCPNRSLKPDQLNMKTYLRQAIKDGRPCEICGRVTKHMVLDHRHGEKTWRGVLCGKHNTGLGMFDDDPELLRAAADYLQKHEKI